jgi:protein gp37
MDRLQLEFPAWMFAGQRGLSELLRRGRAARFSGEGMPYEGLAKFVDHKPRWTGEISFHEDILLLPLRWTKPRKVFVNSMSDLFHEKVTDEMLDKAFAVMA